MPDEKKREKGNESRWKRNLRRIYNALTFILIKKDSTTSQGLNPPKKKRKFSDSEKFGNLLIVGTGRENHTSYRKMVQTLRRLIAMRVGRKKRVEELMTKREGTFLQKNNKAVERVFSNSQ